MLDHYCIGIDLGTTNSCVAIYRSNLGRAETLTSRTRESTVPSVVHYPDTSKRSSQIPITGRQAVARLVRYPERTFYGVKRLIGRKYCPKLAEQFHYQLTSDSDDNFLIQLPDGQTLRPEQVSAQVLATMRQIAEESLGCRVTRAVVTVPAYFDDGQRQATLLAAKLAGLKVERIINEPTAACLAYGLDRIGDEFQVLVLDVGGGTVDASVLDVAQGLFEVLGCDGDSNLGGEDFDLCLMNYFITTLGLDMLSSENKLTSHQKNNLKQGCEQLKCQLSLESNGYVVLNSFFKIEQIDELNKSLNRDQDQELELILELDLQTFSEIITPIAERCLAPVDRLLRLEKIDVDEIRELVLVGGMTRMPMLRQLLQTRLPLAQIHSDLNPDQAIALGAAVQAAMLGAGAGVDGKSNASDLKQEPINAGATGAGVGVGEGDGTSGDFKLKQMLLVDVNALSLGVETMGGLMSSIIARNTAIPCEQSSYYTTVENNQTSVAIKVYQGERPLCEDNRCLGTFTLDGLPEVVRGIPKIKVTFKLDSNGTLTVTAHDEISDREQIVKVERDSTRLSETEVERLVYEAERYRGLDTTRCSAVKLKKELLSTVFEFQRMVEDRMTVNEADDAGAGAGAGADADAGANDADANADVTKLNLESGLDESELKAMVNNINCYDYEYLESLGKELSELLCLINRTADLENLTILEHRIQTQVTPKVNKIYEQTSELKNEIDNELKNQIINYDEINQFLETL